jgi:hypothetical protein
VLSLAGEGQHHRPHQGQDRGQGWCNHRPLPTGLIGRRQSDQSRQKACAPGATPARPRSKAPTASAQAGVERMKSPATRLPRVVACISSPEESKASGVTRRLCRCNPGAVSPSQHVGPPSRKVVVTLSRALIRPGVTPSG